MFGWHLKARRVIRFFEESGTKNVRTPNDAVVYEAIDYELLEKGPYIFTKPDAEARATE